MIYRKPKRTVRTGPEQRGANRLMIYMRARGWTCMKLGGGKFTVGWPDYYCFHKAYGHRWIEMKKPGGEIRQSQIKRFTDLNKAGDKVFVLRDERDYPVIFKEQDNWGMFIKMPKRVL